ncbi:hypothetical protein OG905_11280 [Streptomyces sp. NBC_00322]|uniref:hypothetical protein n=1 Tax=Streptomyces sp. NBC_00322 TaxID=2975712 RepID=UPI002E28B7C4|nr:hypothetical protein [Streptomyces sp. NBC_00322]
MRRAPRTIEEALERARVFDGRYTAAHMENSRRRITEKLTELRWMQLFAGPGSPAGRPAGGPPAALHERAAHDLRALCQGVIHDADAARRIARFDTARDPGGALAFACLLVLADKEEGAQFWWQFAAGAGNATSAVCLYLLHLRRGELRDAQHWAQQTAALEDEPCQYTPVAHEVFEPAPPVIGVTVHIAFPEDGAVVSEDAVRDALQDLDVGQVDGFGPIPQPSPDLARQLKGLVATTR